ncbi:MAG: hypothetical protein WDM86_07115 [Rhizomicrobium sp.]
MRILQTIFTVAAWLCLVGAGPMEAAPARKIVLPPVVATLSVGAVIVPASDPGRFNLLIDGTPRAAGVGNGGSTAAIVLPPGTHAVSVTAAGGTVLSNYQDVIGGNCAASGAVHLGVGQHASCTVTLTRLGQQQHGSWVRGPGTYTFTACANGGACNVVAAPGQSVAVTFEVWGAGGGGGGGEDGSIAAGRGGGGGGGGGYAKTVATVAIPQVGVTRLYVIVGAGASGGLTASSNANQMNGGYGGNTVVWTDAFYGTQLVRATGGAGGGTGVGPSYGYNGGQGGGPGSGSTNGWSGTAGYHGGVTSGCNGAGRRPWRRRRRPGSHRARLRQ